LLNKSRQQRRFIYRCPRHRCNCVWELIKAIDDEGNELYPTKCNHDFIDLPVVRDREQRRPSFSAEQIEAIVKGGDRTTQMATILFASAGLRAGELFGLEIRHFDGAAVKVEQEVWNGIIQAPKTDNAHRTIELDSVVSKLLKIKERFPRIPLLSQYVSAQRCRVPGRSAEILARPLREPGHVRSIRQDPGRPDIQERAGGKDGCRFQITGRIERRKPEREKRNPANLWYVVLYGLCSETH
jgi:integrase